MRRVKLCKGYLASLKHAIKHTREVFAKMDGCKPEQVEAFHPSEYELNINQMDLFKNENTTHSTH